MALSTKEILLAREISIEIKDVMKEHQLLVRPLEYKSYLKNLIDETVINWDFVRTQVFGKDLTKIWNETLIQQDRNMPSYVWAGPRLFTFGYSLGFELSGLCGGNDVKKHQAGLLGGFFNMYTTFFDMICDKKPHLFKRLEEIVSKKFILEAVDLSHHKNQYFICSERDDLAIKILVSLMNEYFKLLRYNYNRFNDAIIKEFQNVLVDSYQSEIDTKNKISLSQKNVNEIKNTLFNKSVLPTWALGITSIMCSDMQDLTKISQLKEILFDIGKTMWISDDLTDIAEDLNNNQWNFVLLHLFSKHNISVLDNTENIKPRYEVLSDLLKTGTIRDCINQVCEKHNNSINLLKREYRNSERISKMMTMWLNSWVN
ncbi:MAG: hypothetical protein K5798_03830 [Nitrosopumilus sp.]|uniref:hypothetical protein n=1 Tax=Nitrosopumilus sp. TaxID=2024843 RepID=UPI00242C247A|nr:hypothetical protein [Nitrosopumilus sp.]MCV0366382.1 hypothetical protein [Nitrosopumilus sp.]